MICPLCEGPTRVANTAHYINGKIKGGRVARMSKEITTRKNCILRMRKCKEPDCSFSFETVEMRNS